MRDGGPEALPIIGYTVGNALGATKDAVLRALWEGRSALRPAPFELPFTTTCGVFPEPLEPLSGALAPYDSRAARIALTVLDPLAPALARAVQRWGRARVAIVIGSSTGGVLELERAWAAHRALHALPASFDFERQHAYHGLLEVIRRRAGAAGPAYVVSTACASSAKVLGAAQRLISAGLADAALVGGVDSLCDTTLRGFAALSALSPSPCRPFCAERDGTSLGEGAAFLLLERTGESAVKLLSVGESCDAHHMSHPHPEGAGARQAMEAALQRAGVEAAAIDYVNAHGTGTLANDAAEARAIAAVFGERTPVSSTKAYAGHLLGAAGATEAVFAALTLEHGFAPASLGAAPLDPRISLDVLRCKREGRFRRALSNSLGFGGSNAAVLLGAA